MTTEQNSKTFSLLSHETSEKILLKGDTNMDFSLIVELAAYHHGSYEVWAWTERPGKWSTIGYKFYPEQWLPGA